MFKIPFNWLPGSIGLRGKTRSIAQAEYELTGIELELRLLELRKDDMKEDDYNHKLYDIQHKFGKISEPEYHRNLASLIKDEKQRTLAILELDHREGKISYVEYEKQCATLKNESWVRVLNMGISTGNSLEGSFELDWNEHFIKELEGQGYIGPDADNIVNQWFMTVCKNIALEEFDGVGTFTPDVEANMEAYKRWSHESISSGRSEHR